MPSATITLSNDVLGAPLVGGARSVGRFGTTPGKGRMRPASTVVGVVLGTTAVLTVVGLVMAGSKGATAFTQASFQAPASLPAVGHAVWRGLRLSTLDPNYWAFVAFLTLCQWRWPAQRDQRNNFSVDMAVDLVWFVMGNAMQFTVVAVVLGAVTVAYTELLGTWSLDLQPLVGFWGLAVFAFVFTDALAWLSHWCHHKVRTLWRFHAVHHSQRRLNALSDNRTHVGEVVAAALIVFVPSQLLGLNAATSTGLAFIGIYYSAMLHSNIRTNLGPLRFILLGPQAHRVHHSILPRYYEHNFGTVFPWWDFLAGTYYWGVNEYPATGITDEAFPLRDRRDVNPLKWLVIFTKQLAYPFACIYRDLAAWVSASPPPAPALLPAGAGSPSVASGQRRTAGATRPTTPAADWVHRLSLEFAATRQLGPLTVTAAEAGWVDRLSRQLASPAGAGGAAAA